MADKKKGASLMDMLSFVAVVVGGVGLLVASILGKIGISANIVGTLQMITNMVGWIVLCFLSFNYIRGRKSVLLWVLWAIAVVMIVVGIIL